MPVFVRTGCCYYDSSVGAYDGIPWSDGIDSFGAPDKSLAELGSEAWMIAHYCDPDKDYGSRGKKASFM